MQDYAYLDQIRHDILKMVPDEGKVIGSIGCGRAATEAVLVQQGRDVHGVDVAPDAVATARTRLTSARLVDANDECPFSDASLDGLILADVIEHLPLAWLRLQSFVRAVKPGGWVVISVPNNRYAAALAPFILKGDWPEYPLGIYDQTHVQVMTHRRLDRWCKQAGLLKEKEFDSYDYRFFWRNVCRALNLGSFRLLKSFLTFEVQARFRKPDTA